MSYADQIRIEQNAKDMRELIADGIEENKNIADSANTKSDSAVSTANNANNRVDNIISGQIEGKDQEIVDSHYSNVTQENFNNIGERFDGIDSSLADIATINALLLGFKANDPTFDNTPRFQQLMSTFITRTNITFPSGIFYFSELLIPNNRVWINGVLAPADGLGTVFKPFQANQRFIIKIGGNSDYSDPGTPTTVYGSKIYDITFMEDNHQVTDCLLYIDYCSCIRLSVAFRLNKNTAIKIRASWELDFDNLYVRPDHPIAPQIVFEDTTALNTNISAITFKHLDSEYCNTAPLFWAKDNCRASNIIIENWSFEDLIETYQQNGIDNTHYTLTEFLNFQKNPLFVLDYIDGLTIGNINTCEIGKRYNVSDTEEFFVTSLFRIKKANVNIGTITNSNNVYLWLADGDGDYSTNLHVNSVIGNYNNLAAGSNWGLDDIQKILGLYYTVTTGNVSIDNTNYSKNMYDFSLSGTVTLKSKLYTENELLRIFKIINTATGSQRLLYDADSNNKVVMGKTGTGFSTMTYKFKTDFNARLNLRYKSNDVLNIVLTDYADVIKTIALPVSSVYTTATINFNPTRYKYIQLKCNNIINFDYIQVASVNYPMFFNKTNTPNPSATAFQNGTTYLVQTLDAYNCLYISAADIIFGGTFNSELVTTTFTVTYEDNTSSSIQKNSSAVGTSSLTASELMSLVKDGHSIMQISFKSYSSISNSVVSVTVKTAGMYL